MRKMFYGLGNLPIPAQILWFIMCVKAIALMIHQDNNQSHDF